MINLDIWDSVQLSAIFPVSVDLSVVTSARNSIKQA